MTRARSFSRGIGALIGLCLLVVGVPLGLMLVSRAALGTRNPLHGVQAPWHWSTAQIRTTLAHHVSESTLIDVFVRFGVSIIWACLVVVVLTVFAELASQLRHGVALPTIRGLGWSQRIAVGIVAGLLAFAPMHHSGLPSGGALPIRDARPVATQIVRPSASSRSHESVSTTSRGLSHVEPGWRTHRVKPGESIWDIGARLGGGDIEQTHTIVRQILDANIGRAMNDGSVFHDPGYIEAGWSLAVPATGRGPSAVVDHAVISDEHRIVHGDTLWDVVEARYGRVDADMVWHIAGINHLENPSSIPLGTIVSLPTLDATSPTGTAATTDPANAAPANGGPSVPVLSRSSVGTVVVQRGDTLSSIAEQQYGDSGAWPTIYRANEGTKFGDRTLDDPDLIMPGWTLTIPDDATASGPTPRSSAPSPDVPTGGDPASVLPQKPEAPSDSATPVVSGDPSSPAPTPLPDATSTPPTPTPAPASPGSTISLSTVTSPIPARQLPAALPTPVSLVPSEDTTPVTSPVASGASIEVRTDVGASPADNAQEAAPEPAPVTPSGVGGTSPGAAEKSPSAAEKSPGAAETSPPTTLATSVTGQGQRRIPLGPASALVLASGAIGLVEARRRRKLRSAGYATLAPSTPDTVHFESSLRLRSNSERITRLDLAVRSAAPHITAHGLTLTGASVSPSGEIELLLVAKRPSDSGPPTVAEPFVPGSDERSWRLPAAVATEDIPISHRFGAFPAPLLTHVGTSGTDDIFVDLEAFGSIAVVGDPHRAVTIVHGLIGSLSVSPFAETVSMSCFGTSVHAGPLPRLARFEDLGAAVTEANEFATALGGVASASTMFDLRTMSSGEPWEPAVLAICAGQLDDDFLEAGLSPASIGRGVVVLVDRDIIDAGARIIEVPDGWLVSPLGITVQPVGLTEDDLIELDDLIAVADIEPTPVPLVAISDDEAAFQEMPWSLMVRLLGPVDVVDTSGATAEISKSKAVELVAWLVEHRRTATRTGARSAMWEADVRDTTFANVVSEARRSLARLVTAPEGAEWIARTQTEQLPLHSLVVSDAAVLRQRLDYARACADPEEAVYVLRPGVQLVRDIPFSGTSYIWADSEGSLSNLTLLITAAATELGNRYLQTRNLEGVFWATSRGLAVLPGHEDLIALRMRARHDAGDLAGLRAEWDAYERVTNADTWSDGEPSAKMEALRQELLRPSMSRRP